MANIQQKMLEEKLLKATRARRRFKAAVRHVIHNMFWIQDDDDSAEIDPANIRRTVIRLTRKQLKKTKGGLSIKEKSILRKDARYRTLEEKKILNKYIGGLKCFRGYPENVQMELVEATYFEYYGPGRVLIRQNDEGQALYFILSGEVVISKITLDEVANVYQDLEINRTSAGNMFGQLSLLHNIPRTATVTTSDHCELLVLRKDDFDRVLKKSLLQRWDDIRVAMLKFRYFDKWDNVAIRECCMHARLKTYQSNQVIYGDRKRKVGDQQYTYFVVEGSCSVVEHLFVEETVKKGIKYYKLYTPPETGGGDLPASSMVYESSPGADVENSHIEHDNDSKTSCVLPKPTDSAQSCINNFIRESISILRVNSMGPAISQQSLGRGRPSAPGQNKRTYDTKRSTKMSIFSYKDHLLDQMRMSEDLNYKLPNDVHLRFMQVCIFKEQGTFRGGDLMQNRRVIALTPMKLLLIPTYWLRHHNKGNVWTRVEYYLQSKMPSREQIFKEYVKSKKWQQYRKKIRDEILSQKKFYNNTTIHDVPYSIRIMNNYEL